MTESSFARNLKALGEVDPDLRRRVTSCGRGARLRADGGRVVWSKGLQDVPLCEDEAPWGDAVAGGESVVLVGAGEGRLVEGLLGQACGSVIVWDRDPGFLIPMLRLRDVSDALRSGRLRLAAGSDWLDLYAHPHRVVHPQLGAAYVDELDFRGERPCVLLVEGTLFVDDLGESLRSRGYDVFRWGVAELPEAELERTAAALAPVAVFGINHVNGLAEACARLGVPLVEWEIDPSTDAIRPTHVPGASVWTWRRSQVEKWRRAGFESGYLPLATNPRRRRPVALSEHEVELYGVPVAYVGSSMVARGDELLREFLTTFVEAYGDAAAGRTIAQHLLEIQSRNARYVLPGLLHKLSPRLAGKFAKVGCRHRPEALLGEAAAARYRLEVLGHIADLELHCWGDPGWRRLESRGARYRGWAGHYQELTKIYSAAQVHVDVGRLYQLDIVPMRIFDVIASGGFVLAQHSEALVELLDEGTEIITWRSPEELRDLVKYYLDRPDARDEVVAAGRARVLRDHTIDARVNTLLSAVPGVVAAAS